MNWDLFLSVLCTLFSVLCFGVSWIMLRATGLEKEYAGPRGTLHILRGLNLELRKKSLEQITSVDLPGFALGGLTISEDGGLEEVEEFFRSKAIFSSRSATRASSWAMRAACDRIMTISSGLERVSSAWSLKDGIGQS